MVTEDVLSVFRDRIPKGLQSSFGISVLSPSFVQFAALRVLLWAFLVGAGLCARPGGVPGSLGCMDRGRAQRPAPTRCLISTMSDVGPQDTRLPSKILGLKLRANLRNVLVAC